MTFVIGPMCSINRISAEPPSHPQCAEFSAKACPFLSKPKAKRREADMPEGTLDHTGLMIDRNPGVTLLYGAESYDLAPAPGGFLFALGAPRTTRWFCEGRLATRAEVDASIQSGLPILQKEADAQGPEAQRALARAIKRAESILPTEIRRI